MDEQTLLYALETSAFLVPELPERVARLDVPGIQGRITADSDPFANLVGAATLDEGNADETIRQVCEIYAGWNKEFGWLVSPLFDAVGSVRPLGRAQAWSSPLRWRVWCVPTWADRSRPTRRSTSTRRPPMTWKPRSTRWPMRWRSRPIAPTR